MKASLEQPGYGVVWHFHLAMDYRQTCMRRSIAFSLSVCSSFLTFISHLFSKLFAHLAIYGGQRLLMESLLTQTLPILQPGHPLDRTSGSPSCLGSVALGIRVDYDVVLRMKHLQSITIPRHVDDERNAFREGTTLVTRAKGRCMKSHSSSL